MNVDVRIAEGDSVFLKRGLHSVHYVKIHRPVIFVFAPSTRSVKDVVISELLDVRNGALALIVKNQGVVIYQLKQYRTYLFYVIVV